MLTFLVIAIIEVFIIDISGVMQSLVHPLLKKLFNIKGQIRVPLFDCSLCVVFHTGWIYLLATNQFTAIAFLFTTMVSFLSSHIRSLLLLISDSISILILYINKLLNESLNKKNENEK